MTVEPTGLMELLNVQATHFKPLIEAADSGINLLISFGLFWLAIKASAIAKAERRKLRYKINSDDRAVFRDNHKKVTEALGLVYREGTVGDKAMNLIWEAREQALLELPKSVQNHTGEIYDLMMEVYQFHNQKAYDKDGNQIKDPDKAAHIDRELEIVRKLVEMDPGSIYSRYMKIIR